MYMSVTLRNVNLQYRLGNVNLRSRLECQFVLTPGQDIGYVHYTTTLGRPFLAMEDGEDSVAGHSQCTYLSSQMYKRVLSAADSLKL